jgi:hypothetical protein
MLSPTDKPPSAPVRELIVSVRGRLDGVVEMMLEHYRTEIPAYQDLPQPVVDADVREVSRRNLLAFLRGLEEPGPLEPAEDSWLRAVGARRAEQGLALADVLHAYRAGARIVWGALVQDSAGISTLSQLDIANLAAALLDFLDRVSTAVEEAYFEEWQAHVLRTVRRRSDLADELVGQADPVAVRRMAADAGVVLPDVVVVACLPSGNHAPATSDAELPGFLAEVQGRSVFFVDAAISADAIEALAGRCGAPIGWAEPRSWNDGLGPAFISASRTADLGSRLGLTGAVASHQMAAHRLLTADNEAAQLLFESSFGALIRVDRTGELLKTVESYLESGCNLTVAAEQLHVHPNTVKYRLRIADERGGVVLDTPDQRFAALLALRARRLQPAG